VELASALHNAAAPVPPPGKLAKGSQSVAARNTSSRSYVVKKGETLGAIAHKMGCGSVSEIASSNHLKAPAYALKPGQTLQVPACHK
jgi:membrane-bound lytic murein transglycosylase D